MVGQFTSADTLLAGGLNRYGYVGGNPTTATDPSGHMLWVGGGKDFGGGGVAAALAIFGLSTAAGGGVRTLPVTAIPIPGSSSQISEPDEMDRANARAADVGFESWNQVSANRYKAAHPTKTTSTTTTPTDTPTPPTQPGNDGAGAPPGGPRPPGGLAHPEDDNGCGCGRPLNSKGHPYPSVIDPRTGQEMPFPQGDLQRIPKSERVEWNNVTRGAYIKEWLDRGYPEPEGGWDPYDIHHILPKEFGGTNGFWNLVPILRTIHNGPAPEGVTAWWDAYCPD